MLAHLPTRLICICLLLLFSGCTDKTVPDSPTAVFTVTVTSPPPSPTAAEPTAQAEVTVTPTQHPTIEPTPVVITTTPTPLSNSPWQTLAKMPTSRSEMPAVALNGRIYVPGGFGNSFSSSEGQKFEAYDIASDAWITLAPLPVSLNHHAMAVYKDDIYVFGDQKQPGLRYELATDSWQMVAAMPESRWAGTAVVLENGIYIIGGAGGSAALLHYQPEQDTWQTLAEMTQPREHLQAVVFNGEIWALGGRWQRTFNTVEIYNPESNAWRRGPSMNQPRSGFGAAVFDGQIWVAGGELLSPLNTLESVEIFDGENGRWQMADFVLPTPLHGFPLVVASEALYAVGGSGVAGDISNRGQLYRFRP